MAEFNLPFSQACERNKDPILEVIQPHLKQAKSVLEIGSGTGQHALYFAQNLVHLNWQTSDQEMYLAGINAQINNAKDHDRGLSNLLSPFELDVTQKHWLPKSLQNQKYDAIYSANTLHIMAWPQVEALFEGLYQVTKEGTYLIVYGPFKYQGKFTSESNGVFDQDLRSRGVGSAIRDIEAADKLANSAGFKLVEDVAMPANNQCLIWQNRNI
ncbi:MAG: DUF938 domain-containing protein [Acidiferrobacterales bacterium]|nr:DUF938 domain-containing protein [Acidiferrobacterales bacterium]